LKPAGNIKMDSHKTNELLVSLKEDLFSMKEADYDSLNNIKTPSKADKNNAAISNYVPRKIYPNEG